MSGAAERAAPMYRITVEDAVSGEAAAERREPPATYHITQRETVVGRAPHADLRLDEPFVSRRHARLLLRGARLHLEDLESTNFTWLNGDRVETRMGVGPGDRVAFGPVHCRIESPSGAGALPEDPDPPEPESPVGPPESPADPSQSLADPPQPAGGSAWTAVPRDFGDDDFAAVPAPPAPEAEPAPELEPAPAAEPEAHREASAPKPVPRSIVIAVAFGLVLVTALLMFVLAWVLLR